MALESGTYISDLNVSNPAGSDLINQADDHLRLLKQVLKNTFPNITAAVTPTHTQLNQALVPIGGVIMWSGSAASVPTGWALCDGGSYSRSDGGGTIVTPDLRNKFVLGCGGSTGAPTAAPTIGTTGGASSATPTITVTNEAVALTTAQMPTHNHTVTDPGHLHTITDPGHTHTVNYYISGQGTTAGGSAVLGGTTSSTQSATTGISMANATTGISLANAGSGNTHIHNNTAVSSAVATLPPYYTLAFICKI